MNSSSGHSGHEGMTIRCPKCGNRTWKTSKFCGLCGQPLNPAGQPGAPRPIQPQPPRKISPPAQPPRTNSGGIRRFLMGCLAGGLSIIFLLACTVGAYFAFGRQWLSEEVIPALSLEQRPSLTPPPEEVNITAGSRADTTRTPEPAAPATNTPVPGLPPTATEWVIPSLTATPEVPPVFYDSFDTGISSAWEFGTEDDWSTLNGMLVNMRDVSSAFVGELQWRNYALDVDVVNVEDGSCHFEVAYTAPFDSVAMEVDSYGWIAWSHLDTAHLSEVEFPFHLRLELSGELVTGLVNGVLVGTTSIPGMDHGRAGISCFRGDYGDSGLFDNFQVSPLP